MKIFLSHNSNDKDVAEDIGRWFSNEGYDLRLDKWCLTPADSLVEKIGEGIESSDKLVVLLSPDTVNANWVKKEVATGLVLELAEEKGLGEKFVIPALIKKCKVPIMLRDKLYADYTDKPFEAACNQLLSGILDKPSEPLDKKHENGIVRHWNVKAKGGSSYALVIEFGVSISPTTGVYVGIDVGSKYKNQREWFGIPNNKIIPNNTDEVYTNSSERIEPPIYARKFDSPNIEASKSFYIYFESDEPFEINEFKFLDFYGRVP